MRSSPWQGAGLALYCARLGAMRVKLPNMLSIFADSLGQASNFQSIVINGCSPKANLIFPACLGKCLEAYFSYMTDWTDVASGQCRLPFRWGAFLFVQVKQWSAPGFSARPLSDC